MLNKAKALVNEFLTHHPEGLLVVLGPTASGKTGLSVQLAHWIKAHLGKTVEIISVDSRQIYKGCDISSAKITTEEMEGVTHHGIDIVDLETDYSVHDWQQYCFETIEAIKTRGHIPMLVGGTMLWLDAVTLNYDFDEKGTKSDRQLEPLWPILQLGLMWPREVLYERINERAQAQFENGLIEETVQILSEYKPSSSSPQQGEGKKITKTAFTSFGYLEIEAYLKGLITYDEALSKNQQRNRSYAKKQLTWWRGRDEVHWLV